MSWPPSGCRRPFPCMLVPFSAFSPLLQTFQVNAIHTLQERRPPAPAYSRPALAGHCSAVFPNGSRAHGTVTGGGCPSAPFRDHGTRRLRSTSQCARHKLCAFRRVRSFPGRSTSCQGKVLWGGQNSEVWVATEGQSLAQFLWKSIFVLHNGFVLPESNMGRLLDHRIPNSLQIDPNCPTPSSFDFQLSETERKQFAFNQGDSEVRCSSHINIKGR